MPEGPHIFNLNQPILPEVPDLPIDGRMEIGISSGEFCDACDHMTDVFISLAMDGEFPFVLCRSCINSAYDLVNGKGQ